MGFYESIEAEWACPFCGTRQSGEIQIKYGSITGRRTYHIGDKIQWLGDAYEGGRVPNGTGIIRGNVSCTNDWWGRWQDVGKGKAPDTREERKKYGCPTVMEICIEIENDMVTRVFFPDDVNEIIPGGW